MTPTTQILLKRIILCAALVVTDGLCYAKGRLARANDSESDAGSKQSAVLFDDEFGQQLYAIYDRVNAAVVRVGVESSLDHKVRATASGVIITPQGHVVFRVAPAAEKIEFHLSDGRAVAGMRLGYSHEWGIEVAKLREPGPWPYVDLSAEATLKSDQEIITLSYALFEPTDSVPHPLLSVDLITAGSTGQWFTRGHQTWHSSQLLPIAFDCKGRLLGVGTRHWFEDRTDFTAAPVISSLWKELAAGKNLDAVRLGLSATIESGHVERRPDDRPVTTQQDVAERIKNASVRLVGKRLRAGREYEVCWSGTLIDPKGLIATCAHVAIPTRSKVTVSLTDGRDLDGEVIGVSPICDISLVRVKGPGPFPHAELGNSRHAGIGSPCFYVGYGPVNRQSRVPSIRESSIAQAPAGIMSYAVSADRSIRLAGGDSGGGLFDVHGRIIAIHSNVQFNPRIELFALHAAELQGAVESGHSQVSLNSLNKSLVQLRDITVEVLDSNERVSLGTIVTKDGKIATKASSLRSEIRCRLGDGRVLPAKLLKAHDANDLAILKIEASNLPTLQSSLEGNCQVGTPVQIGMMEPSPSLSFVSCPPLSLPFEVGKLQCDLVENDSGLVVVSVNDPAPVAPLPSAPRPRLQVGDVLLKIGERSVTNLDSYLTLLSPEGCKKPIAIAGDRVPLVVRRNGQEVDTLETLVPVSDMRHVGQSLRSSGFAKVYSVTTTLDSPLCGEPVADSKQRIIGIAIAWRAKGWLLVLPMDVIQAAVND